MNYCWAKGLKKEQQISISSIIYILSLPYLLNFYAEIMQAIVSSLATQSAKQLFCSNKILNHLNLIK